MTTSGEGDGLFAASLTGCGAAPLADWLIEHQPAAAGRVSLGGPALGGRLCVTWYGEFVECSMWLDRPSEWTGATLRWPYRSTLTESAFADEFPRWLADCLATPPL